jgi:hypothetical protein
MIERSEIGIRRVKRTLLERLLRWERAYQAKATNGFNVAYGRGRTPEEAQDAPPKIGRRSSKTAPNVSFVARGWSGLTLGEQSPPHADQLLGRVLNAL